MAMHLAEKAYRYIHKRLSSGHYEPGARLSNRSLAAEIGTSFTPVREALNRLAAEGLLEFREGIGMLIPVIGWRDIVELCEMREILECAMAKKLAGCLNIYYFRDAREIIARSLLADTSDANSASSQDFSLQTHDLWSLNCEFHLRLLQESANRRLVNMVSSELMLLSQVASQSAWKCLNAAEQIANEHEQILQMLGSGKSRYAFELMTQHLYTERKLLLKAPERGGFNFADPNVFYVYGLAPARDALT